MQSSILISSLFAVSVVPFESTVLKRDLSPAVDRYEIKCVQTTVPGEGMPGNPRTVKATWKAAYKTEAGGALTVAITDYTFTAEGANLMSPPPRERTIKAHVDSLGQVTPRSPGTNALWMVVDQLPLPGRVVKVGDSWQVTLPESTTLGKTPIKLPAKITGTETFAGRKAWVVSVSGKNVATSQTVQVRMGSATAQEAKITGRANVDIKVLVDHATGKTLKVQAKVHCDQEMDFPGAPMPTPSSIDYTGTMTWVK
jgi:hypothetical protein